VKVGYTDLVKKISPSAKTFFRKSESEKG